MGRNRNFLLVSLVLAVLGASGCAATVTLQLADRTIEVRGLKRLRVNGGGTVNINGTDLIVSGSAVRYGKSRVRATRGQTVVISGEDAYVTGSRPAAPQESSRSWWQFWR